MCQSRLNALHKKAPLFDHLVGGGKQRRRYAEAKHLCRLSVDDQFKLRRLHNRKILRLRALEDAAGIDANLAECVGKARSIADQPAGFGKVTQWICCGEPVERRQLDQLDTAGEEERGDPDEKRLAPLSAHSFARGLAFIVGIAFEDPDLQPETASRPAPVPQSDLRVPSSALIDDATT